MSHGAHASPPEPPASPARAERLRALLGPRAQRVLGAHHSRRRTAWRVGTPAVLLLSGSLFAVSAASSQGTDLRPGRYTDVASLVRAESTAYERLRQQVQDLNGQVASLAAAVDDPQVARLQQRTAELKSPAGLEPVRGVGVKVTLSDSPLPVPKDDDGLDDRWFVVHQQDVQAVLNAMWRAGARAITVQGQRIVSISAIKCEGNSITIQGVPYPQPYVISALGDPGALQSSLTADPYLQGYIAQSQDPRVQIGWSLEDAEVKAPAYDDVLALSYAKPVS